MIMSDSGSPALRVAVLISGSGTTLRNLLEKIDQHRLPIEVALVISSNPAAGGLQYAVQREIPWRVQAEQKGQAAEDYSRDIFAPCREANVGLVVMGGFLKHVLVPPDFVDRVINIHPSLIPSFCGQSYYGRRVHEAVLEYGTKVSGCTVHFVDNEYDHGPIIAQEVVPVLSHDTPETLAARVFEAECEVYPRVIHQFAQGRIRRTGRCVHIDD